MPEVTGCNAIAAVSGLLLLIGNLLGSDKLTTKLFSRFSITSLAVCIFVELHFFLSPISFCDKFFMYTPCLSFIKLISMAFFAIYFISARHNLQNWTYALSFGMLNSILLCLSANNFLILLVGLEIATFSICILVMQNGYMDGARECSVRFLILSECMTGIVLYGLSLCCADGGGLSFTEIRFVDTLSFKIGGVLVASGLLFKLGLVPFHTWLVDLYEKSRLGLVMFLDSLWKFVMIVIFARVWIVITDEKSSHLKLSLKALSIISMAIGSIMPLFEKDIKKFIAYASVGHIGFIITSFSTSCDFVQTSSAIVYSLFYSIASACFFSSIYTVDEDVRTFDEIQNVNGYGRTRAYCTVASLFAMIGMPPFANFFAKLQILKLQISSGDYTMLVASIAYSILCLVFASQKSMIIMRNCEENIYNGARVTMIFYVLLMSIILFEDASVLLTSLTVAE
jgi:NADH-quinone oxidoreductase subunit N